MTDKELNGKTVYVVLFNSGGVTQDIAVLATEEEAQALIAKTVGMTYSEFEKAQDAEELPEEYEDITYYSSIIGKTE